MILKKRDLLHHRQQAEARNTPNDKVFILFQMLNENSQLLQTIQDFQNKGKAQESVQYVCKLW